VGFEIVPEDVINHAGNVDQLGTRLADAGRAGGTVDLGIETYGIIGQAFSLSVRGEISQTAAAISEAASAFPDIADALRDCADLVRETDAANSTVFDTFLRGDG
jgi:hypothetical protein